MFEFDSTKSEINWKKHGIDFDEAQKLWEDKNFAMLDSNYSKEKRNLFIAEMDGKIWAAITTIRGKKLRLISVRRARDGEKEIYFSRKIR
jgi:hypothetical protein